MHRSAFSPSDSAQLANPRFNDSGGSGDGQIISGSELDCFLDELFETIETTTTTTTTTTFEVFQVPDVPPPTPRRSRELGGQLINEPFRWTGLPLEQEDDLISAVPDVVSISSTEEPSTDGRACPVEEVTEGQSSSDETVEIDAGLGGERSLEVMRTNLEVAIPECRLNSTNWIEGCNDEPPDHVQWQLDEIELDTSDYYRNFFIVWNHFNLIGHDRKLGPILLSFTAEETVSKEKHYRVLLWLPTGTLHKVIPTARIGPSPSPIKLARVLYNQIDVDHFKPIVAPEASTLIASFEKDVQASNYLFTVLRSQRSKALNEFLEFLGQLVQLRDRTLVFTVFNEKDIEFRVCSLHDSNQQSTLSILFQEYPSTVQTDAYILVQQIGSNRPNVRRYRVTVGEDQPTIFEKSPELREFILSKLINADNASKAEQLRAPLLRKLISQLEKLTGEFLGTPIKRSIKCEPLDDQERSSAKHSEAEVNSWRYTQLQKYLDDYRKLMSWVNWMKTQIDQREYADEVYQERIAAKFASLEQFGAELLRVNSEVTAEIQRQVEPLQTLVSQCKNDLMKLTVSRTPTPPPPPPPPRSPPAHVPAAVSRRQRQDFAIDMMDTVEKEEPEEDGPLLDEALVYQRLVAGVEDEGDWISEKERWLKRLKVKGSVSCLMEKHDEFMKEFVLHRDNCNNMYAEGKKLKDERFNEAAGQLCTVLSSWFDQLQKLATQSLVHAVTAELGNSSVATGDSGILSTDSTLQSDTPLTILDSLAKSIRVDKKHLWTTCVGMRRAWQYNRFLYISEVTLAQIIEIVGFFLDYVASLVRKDSPVDPDKITKRHLQKHIGGPLFRFFREDRPRGERNLDTLIRKRVLKERFLKTFSRKTKIANDAATLLHLLTLDFVMYLRNNTRKVLDGSYVTQFDHIDKALRGIGFGFLIRPE